MRDDYTTMQIHFAVARTPRIPPFQKPARRLADLAATRTFRREFNCAEFYAPGAARRIFSASGAEMYFCDSLGADRAGRPFLLGRSTLLAAERMHPWRHLRAAVFVFDRMALRCYESGAPGATYILDIGRIARAGTVTPMGAAPSTRGMQSRVEPSFAFRVAGE